MNDGRASAMSPDRTEALALPDPELRWDGARLRPWNIRDATELVAAWNDPTIAEFNPVPEHATNPHCREMDRRLRRAPSETIGDRFGHRCPGGCSSNWVWLARSDSPVSTLVAAPS